MQKYGIIKNDKLKIVKKGTAGAKPIQYDPVPEFDQLTQAVHQIDITDEGDYIRVKNEIREVEIDEQEEGEDMF